MVSRYVPPEKRLQHTLKAHARSTRDAQRPTGTERERALLQVQEAVAQLAGVVDGLNDVVTGLAAVVAALPLVRIGQGNATGFPVTTSWVTAATITIPTPEGKPDANILAVGGVRVPWSSDGSKWPTFAARAVIDGVAGPATQLSGAITATGSSLSGTAGGSFQASLERNGTSPVTVALQVAITGWVVNDSGGPLSIGATEINGSAHMTFAGDG